MSNYILHVGKFQLAQELTEAGFRPIAVRPSPFSPIQSIWDFKGTPDTARIAKAFYDTAGLDYSRSLQMLLNRLDEDKGENYGR